MNSTFLDNNKKTTFWRLQQRPSRLQNNHAPAKRLTKKQRHHLAASPKQPLFRSHAIDCRFNSSHRSCGVVVISLKQDRQQAPPYRKGHQRSASVVENMFVDAVCRRGVQYFKAMAENPPRRCWCSSFTVLVGRKTQATDRDLLIRQAQHPLISASIQPRTPIGHVVSQDPRVQPTTA